MVTESKTTSSTLLEDEGVIQSHPTSIPGQMSESQSLQQGTSISDIEQKDKEFESSLDSGIHASDSEDRVKSEQPDSTPSVDRENYNSDSCNESDITNFGDFEEFEDDDYSSGFEFEGPPEKKSKALI